MRFLFNNCLISNNCVAFGLNNGEKSDDILTYSKQKCGNVLDEYFCKNILNDDLKIEAKKMLQCVFDGSASALHRVVAKRLCVVLHGWGASGELYVDLASRLMDNFDLVVVPDLPGFGKSGDLIRLFVMEDYCTVLSRLLDLFDFEELVLVGHSFGGKTILFWMESEQARFLALKTKVVLLAPSGVKPKQSLVTKLKILAYKRAKKKCKSGQNNMKKLAKYGSSDFKNATSDNLRKTFVSVVNTHLDLSPNGDFKNVLLIFGSKDKSTPPWMGKFLLKKFDSAKLKILPNLGHYCFLESPHDVDSLLLDFLSMKN